MTFNKSMSKATNKSFVTIDCDLKEKNQNAKKLIDYAELISPGVLNEKEVCNSLGFFSTKAPKKKQLNSKKIKVDENLKNKRKRLEDYFSTIDLDSWSEHNFVFPGKSDNFHDDLHYIILKQQERSNFIHQMWLILMLALFCILLISIAGVVYQKNSLHKDNQSNESNSYEFIQKFIQDFNHTDAPRTKPDPLNVYLVSKNEDESKDSWLEREAKHLGSLIFNKDNKLLNLQKKQVKSAIGPLPHSEYKNQVNYELLADKSKIIRKIEDKVEDSVKGMVKTTKDGFEKLFKQVQEVF